MEKINNVTKVFFNQKDIILIVPDEHYLNKELPKNAIIVKESVFNKVQNFIKDFNLERVFSAKIEDCTFTPEYWFDRIQEVLTITNPKDTVDIMWSMKALGFTEIKYASKN